MKADNRRDVQAALGLLNARVGSIRHPPMCNAAAGDRRLTKRWSRRRRRRAAAQVFAPIAVARSVSKGRLELVDVQLEMLQKARRRLRRARADNVGYTQASAIQLPFRPATFDVALL